ncbi:MAG: hypothetical protein HYS09_09900 [Chloroflexi bacterium]|nr:hypothetical protein [Chloroflexota bacterium]
MSYQTTSVQTVTGWLGRLLRLDLRVFQEIRSDPSASTWSLLVVVAASFMSGLGSWLWWVFRLDGSEGEAFLKTALLGGLLQVGVWFLWVYIAYQVLARAYGAHADFYEMIRTMGFAFAPMGLAVFMAISSLTIPFGVIPVVAAVLLTTVAIEATTTAESHQVILANLAGFAVFALVMGILANIGEMAPEGGGHIGGIAPGIFFFALD